MLALRFNPVDFVSLLIAFNCSIFSGGRYMLQHAQQGKGNSVVSMELYGGAWAMSTYKCVHMSHCPVNWAMKHFFQNGALLYLAGTNNDNPGGSRVENTPGHCAFNACVVGPVLPLPPSIQPLTSRIPSEGWGSFLWHPLVFWKPFKASGWTLNIISGFGG